MAIYNVGVKKKKRERLLWSFFNSDPVDYTRVAVATSFHLMGAVPLIVVDQQGCLAAHVNGIVTTCCNC